MIDSIKGQLDDWKYGRDILKHFIIELNEANLDKLLPRKNLNTIRKQCEELIQIQGCYVNALIMDSISFEYSPLEDVTKSALLKCMEELDQRMEEILEKYSGIESIDWFGEKWGINRHLSAMIGHEQMHIGQIIGFCYSNDIDIPKYVKQTMSLDD